MKQKTLYDFFGTDKTLEKEGKWLSYNLGGESVFKIKIARAGGANTQYTERLRILAKPYNHRINIGAMDEQTMIGLNIQAYAETVVKDWQNAPSEDGGTLPFSRENVIKLFTDMPDLFKDVAEQAASFESFRRAEQEDATKNS